VIGVLRLGALFSVALLADAPSTALAQSAPTVADFITTIGGETSLKTMGGNMTWPQAQPLVRNKDELLGYRFFAENISSNAMATTERVRKAFATACRSAGGALEPNDGVVAKAFYDRVLSDVIGPRIGKDYWRGHVAVCSKGPTNILGGFVAIVHDTTDVVSKGDIGSRFLSKVFGLPTHTAIYAFRPNQIENRATLEAAAAKRILAAATERADETARTEAFRKEIAVGSETNCGTVIQLRGPMVEIAVPAYRNTPNGQSTFWSKRDRLYPVGPALCSYGL
jgi:hypothetical protein